MYEAYVEYILGILVCTVLCCSRHLLAAVKPRKILEKFLDCLFAIRSYQAVCTSVGSGHIGVGGFVKGVSGAGNTGCLGKCESLGLNLGDEGS